jgi:hypothetical protein
MKGERLMEFLDSPVFWIGLGLVVVVIFQFGIIPALNHEPKEKKKK